MRVLRTILTVDDDMSDTAPLPSLTEPEPIPCLFVNGMAVEISDTVVRLVGWVTLTDLGGEAEERRIVMRLAMSNTHARAFQTVLRKGLARGGN